MFPGNDIVICNALNIWTCNFFKFFMAFRAYFLKTVTCLSHSSFTEFVRCHSEDIPVGKDIDNSDINVRALHESPNFF
jgi:hypothetical protein